MSNRVLVNGKEQGHVAVYDRGLQFGDGVFETIAIDHGKPLLWDQHMDRLLQGCRTLRIGFSDTSLLQNEAGQIIKSADKAVLKIIITRGSAERGYATQEDAVPSRILMLSGWPNYSMDYHNDGVDVCLCRTSMSKHPVLAGIKHLNRLEQVMARGEWDNEFQEGLLCDEQGGVIEGTMSNVFLVKGKGLLTPIIDQCGINGIMRQLVIEYAKNKDIPCQQTKIPITMMQQADAVFLTNSLIGIWPVRKFEKHRYTESEIINTLQESLEHAYPKP